MYAKIRSIIANWHEYIVRYVWPLPRFKREGVVMIDGRHAHGGLTDRFSLIMSVYAYCKAHNVAFRLSYTYPCELTKILLPNKYDWRIEKSDISYSIYDSQELAIYPIEKPIEYTSGKYDAYNEVMYYVRLDRCLSSGRKKQYHVYGNAFFARGDYRRLWNELFTPSPYLQKRLQSVRNSFRCPYEAVTLRFQQLLGDFTEGNFEVLEGKEREELIDTCVKKIDSMYKEGYFSTKRVLVTSDSRSFLEIISQKDYVYTVPGEMEHMDFTDNNNLEMNTKSFVDLYMLSEAKRVTLLKVGKMYRSGFPKFAAELGNVEYCLIEL